MSAAYYNEIEPYAAAWLRNLIAAGHIAPGDVDERSIVDVRADDLAGYTQCHFFAGIAGWSYALRLAGWPDDRPVWTGSCPCQPFSAAGKRGGTDDPRHLWPEWFRLIRECRPATIFGEQVASPAGLGWFDAVSSDLEGEGYAVGAADLCAASVGAPHIRQRLFFVAVSDEGRRWTTRERGRRGVVRGDGEVGPHDGPAAPNAGPPCRMDDSEAAERRWTSGETDDRRRSAETGGSGRAFVLGNPSLPRLAGRSCEPGDDGTQRAAVERTGGDVGGVADAEHSERWSLDFRGSDGRDGQNGGREETHGEPGTRGQVRTVADADGGLSGDSGVQRSGGHMQRTQDAVAGPWSDCIWLPCRDGKARPAPVEPEFQPLAHGVSARVGRLRAYGNAIVPQVAAAFVMAATECLP